MLVAAAPVAVIAKPPFVVSAERASVQPGVLSMTVKAELTSTVLAAVPSRRIRPLTSQAADCVPPAAFWRATMTAVKAWAELFPYLTENQIRTALAKLVEAGLIFEGNHNPVAYDRTKWYGVPVEIHLGKNTNGFGEKPEPIPDSKPVDKPIVIIGLPDWLPIDAWEGWLSMRKTLKKPATERAKQMAIKKLQDLAAEGNDPAAVLDQSTMAGWTDLYPIKKDIKRNGKRNNATQSSDGLSSTARAALSVFGDDGEDYQSHASDEGRVSQSTYILPDLNSAKRYDGRIQIRLAPGSMDDPEPFAF